MATRKTMKSALESMMFIWGNPLDVKVAAEVFNADWRDVYDACKELQKEYEEQERGLVIREIDQCFQFCTKPENSLYIERLCNPAKGKRLSQSALEVLAIIAYKQPVTKGEIDAIRGIKSDRVIEGLEKRGLVEEKGRSSGIGRPILYGTTSEFLAYFGYQSLKELPDIEEIEDVVWDEEEIASSQMEQVSLEL